MIIKELPVHWLVMLSLNLVLGIAGILVLTQISHEQPSKINNRFNEIQSQLTSLQQAVKAPAEKIDLSLINQDFNRLAALIGELKSKNTGELNQLVMESRTQLSNKLDAIHTVINSLDKKQHQNKYLSVSALPFKVISIDSIQHTSVASITYDFKTVPVEKGDSLAGWRVVSLDYGKQSIEFENAKKEHVLLTHEQIG